MVAKMPPTAQKSASIGQAIEAMLADSRSNRLYVIDIEGNLVGLVTSRSIMRLVVRRLGEKQGSGAFRSITQEVLKEGVEQVVQKPVPVKATTSLMMAISLMAENDLEGLPIVDDDYKLVGEIRGVDLLSSSSLFLSE